jgi:hypothetical protein
VAVIDPLSNRVIATIQISDVPQTIINVPMARAA